MKPQPTTKFHPRSVGGQTVKRRIMEEFTIDEISGVDKPAQTPATVAIIKREHVGAMTGDEKEKDRVELRTTLAALQLRLAQLDQPKPEPSDSSRADLTRRRDEIRRRLDEIETEQPTERKEQAMSFEDRVSEIAERDKLKPTDAMRKARLLHADEFLKYQAAPIRKSDDDLIAKRALIRKLDASITQAIDDLIMQAAGAGRPLTRTQALSQLRREQPQLFATAEAA